MKNFIITEEQYKKALKEGVNLKADVAAAGGDVKRAITNAKQEARKSGINDSDMTISISGSDVSESKFITKKNLQESRLRALKKNSQIYSVADFKKKLNLK